MEKKFSKFDKAILKTKEGSFLDEQITDLQDQIDVMQALIGQGNEQDQASLQRAIEELEKERDDYKAQQEDLGPETPMQKQLRESDQRIKETGVSLN